MKRRLLFGVQPKTPVNEIVNTIEMEAEASRQLAPELFGHIAGGGRRAYERITFRPRMMVDTRGMDLSVDLWGEKHFAPFLVGPVYQPERFGKGDFAKGAAAAKASVFRSESPDRSTNGRAVCLSLHGPIGWPEIDAVRKSSPLPLILKGILNATDAAEAVNRGVAGIVVSNYRPDTNGLAAPLEVLPAIAKAVGRRIPILVDGGIRRGGDAIKAIALGASAVMVARPVLWGFAAYGEAGVQAVLEMLQTEMARDMAMLGKRTPAELGPDAIRVHSR